MDQALPEVPVDARHRHALLVVTLGRSVLGEVLVPAEGPLAPAAQHAAIEEHLGDRVWEERLARDFTQATRAPRAAAEPAVSLVVGGPRSAATLGALLDSAAALDPAPAEVLVAGAGHELRDAAEARGARWVEVKDGSAARSHAIEEASGDLVALACDDCTLDPAWLAGLAESFEDPLVAAVAGYTGPLELENAAQCRAHLHGRGALVLHPRVWDRFSFERPRLPRGPYFVRREALTSVGGLARLPPSVQDSELHLRLVAAGWRVAFRTEHLAWRRGSVAQPAAAAAAVPAGWRRRRRIAPQPPPAPPAVPAPRVAASDHPPLSLAIASYNRREPLVQVLEALARQTYPADRFDAVIVLDGSTDGSAERVRALDLPFSVKVVEQENRGLAASRNRGAREASAPVIAFLDDDIVPEPGFVEEHARAHRDSAEPVVALGVCPPADPGRSLPALALRHWWEDYYRRRSEPDHQWNYTDFGDGNVSFPRGVLEDIGGWDEDFASRAGRRQDWELGIRLIQRGVRLLDCPGARGWHHFRTSFENALRQRRIEGRSDVLLGRKHPSARGHLLLMRFLSDPKTLERRDYRLLARRRRASARIIGALAAPARAMEAAGLERRAWQAMVRLLSASYLLGVREQLPGDSELREFLAPVYASEGVLRAPVHLGRPGTLALPPATGPVELNVDRLGAALADVDAVEPESQWDWEVVTRKLVEAARDPYRAAVGEANPAGDRADA
jgi:GT2 family glycosyltransferase